MKKIYKNNSESVVARNCFYMPQKVVFWLEICYNNYMVQKSGDFNSFCPQKVGILFGY